MISRYRNRIIASVVAVLIFMLLNAFVIPYDQNAKDAEVAVRQLDDNAYVEVQETLDYEPVLWVTVAALSVFLVLTWAIPLRNLLKNNPTAVSLGALVLLMGMGCSTCATSHKKDIEYIEPNETAFLIPLSGDTSGQTQFESVQFLKDKQVAAKQITIPYHKVKTGAFLGIIPTYTETRSVTLIRVNRSTVTREWTRTQDTGTDSRRQAFGVESRDSIDFEVGATCGAFISEADAATFLYFYNGKSLEEVMDLNIRGFIQAELFKEFGLLELDDAQMLKSDIFVTVFERTRDEFAKQGITIQYLGGVEGLMYTDPKVQESINKTYETQEEGDRALARATQAAIDNLTLLDTANAQATATVVAGQAGAEVLQLNGEQLRQNPELIDYELAQHSTGQMPNTLIISSDEADRVPMGFFLQEDVSPAPTPTP